MERSPRQSNFSSTSVAFSEEPKERLQASLLLSILKDTELNKEQGVRPMQQHRQSKTIQASSCLSRPQYDPQHSATGLHLVRIVNTLIDSIGDCSEPFEKQLTTSDIIGIQSRLLVNKTDFATSILPMLEKGDDIEVGIPVKTFNPAGKAYPMTFKIWCGRSHVITSGWNLFVKDNRLEVSDIVRVWTFRDVWTRELCLLISSRKPEVQQPIEKEET
ncbi:hypothetical protein ACJRO7_014082 [Eucalyptus globulus]|uniref:TF-B3 domain-containing protein n=1 Tax=Eucalyptus globulus TaxID=34317 RepID=A0ABD3L024_EUCGL